MSAKEGSSNNLIFPRILGSEFGKIGDNYIHLSAQEQPWAMRFGRINISGVTSDELNLIKSGGAIDPADCMGLTGPVRSNC